jgi:hypothetical protein
MIFNADNIWANVQIEDDPTRCSYELFNPTMWVPFFNQSFNKEIAQQQYAMKFDTIQKSIHYTEESFEWYIERASKIERMVERRFEKWRTLTTHWDYGVCKVLRDFLLSFESHAQREEVAINMDRPLQALRNAYGSIYGFPLHFKDSGDKKLLEVSEDNPIIAAVRNTKIHENEDSKAVFALAVYIHPYPNRMVQYGFMLPVSWRNNLSARELEPIENYDFCQKCFNNSKTDTKHDLSFKSTFLIMRNRICARSIDCKLCVIMSNHANAAAAATASAQHLAEFQLFSNFS